MITEEQLTEWLEWAHKFKAMDDDDFVSDDWEEWFAPDENTHVHKEQHLATAAVPALIAEVRRLREQTELTARVMSDAIHHCETCRGEVEKRRCARCQTLKKLVNEIRQ